MATAIQSATRIPASVLGALIRGALRMRFLLDPCVHLLLIAGLLVAVAIGFRIEQEWQYHPNAPASALEVRADD
jgi:hypothetical protein